MPDPHVWLARAKSARTSSARGPSVLFDTMFNLYEAIDRCGWRSSLLSRLILDNGRQLFLKGWT